MREDNIAGDGQPDAHSLNIAFFVGSAVKRLVNIRKVFRLDPDAMVNDYHYIVRIPIRFLLL